MRAAAARALRRAVQRPRSVVPCKASYMLPELLETFC